MTGLMFSLMGCRLCRAAQCGTATEEKLKEQVSRAFCCCCRCCCRLAACAEPAVSVRLCWHRRTREAEGAGERRSFCVFDVVAWMFFFFAALADCPC